MGIQPGQHLRQCRAGGMPEKWPLAACRLAAVRHAAHSAGSRPVPVTQSTHAFIGYIFHVTVKFRPPGMKVDRAPGTAATRPSVPARPAASGRLQSISLRTRLLSGIFFLFLGSCYVTMKPNKYILVPQGLLNSLEEMPCRDLVSFNAAINVCGKAFAGANWQTLFLCLAVGG